MPEKFNAARRVRNILASTRGIPDSERTMTVWSNALDTLGELESDFETVRLLGLLVQEVDRVEEEVDSLGLNRDSYEVTFSNLGRVIAIGNLDAQWGKYGAHITDETLRQLDIFSQLSLIDEPRVPAEDFATLKEDIMEFKKQLFDKEVDVRLRTFILKQVNFILRAMREYSIRGAEAIKDSDAAILATAASEHELIKEHKGEEVLQETGGLWNRMRKLMPNVVINLDPTRMLSDVDPQKVLEAGSDVIDKLQ